jgi:adenylyl- and sulfurtransferase ThiI
MKQFGVTHLEKQFCKCCVILANPRAKVKKQTEKLIKESLESDKKEK